jgi:hypothetical protein
MDLYDQHSLTLLILGFAVRWWQLGIEMRPFFSRKDIWAYPVYMSVGGAFGYWVQGVDASQTSTLNKRKQILLEKRERRLEREAAKGEAEA